MNDFETDARMANDALISMLTILIGPEVSVLRELLAWALMTKSPNVQMGNATLAHRTLFTIPTVINAVKSLEALDLFTRTIGRNGCVTVYHLNLSALRWTAEVAERNVQSLRMPVVRKRTRLH